MSDDKFGQFVQLSEQSELTDDHYDKVHSCKPYLCTNKDCSHADEGEHWHQDLCMHRECAEPVFRKFATLLRETEDEVYDAMIKKDKK
jgi:hypothetical protein